MNENYKHTALIIVDMQRDFMTGGSLQVGANGASEKLIPIINGIAPKYGAVVLTQDWHPKEHCSFKEHGGSWPQHCVADTRGAEIHPDIIAGLAKDSELQPLLVVRKGGDEDFEAYSGFQGDDQGFNGLAQSLRRKKITEVHICGLATNFCVKATAIDAQNEGFKTVVLAFACAGVEIESLNIHVAPAIEEMRAAKIEIAA